MQRLKNAVNNRKPDSSKELQPSHQEIKAMPNPDGTLTPKEQKVVEEFERARPGCGAIATQNIINPITGWSEIIADMTDDVIKAETGTASNSFMYRRIG